MRLRACSLVGKSDREFYIGTETFKVGQKVHAKFTFMETGETVAMFGYIEQISANGVVSVRAPSEFANGSGYPTPGRLLTGVPDRLVEADFKD